ncbi:uncharacterized protein JCM6883_006749 [Sporobolomyces salmoneus]|uniref:uncharacterized protein n=1 Tax=Sporobolomyces salmoneus TaxID=183962 RepID=UPI00317CAE90
MVRSEPTSADFDPARPFVCSECSSRYTRQEHLDRHITAKHRAAKDHICDTCGKGFARKDILKRHQQGHEKQAALAAEAARAEASGVEVTTTAKGKKRAIAHEVHLEDGNGPVKAPRVGRACARCRSSKLRCDGELPCARCQKAGVDCTFDRPSKVAAGRSHSIAMSDDSPGGSSGSQGDSDDRVADYDDDFGLPILPTPPTGFEGWRPPPNTSFPPIPPNYALPPRAPGSLPPNSFLTGGAAGPSYYPPTSNPYNYRPPGATYQNPSMFPSLSLPHHVGSPLNPFAQQHQTQMPQSVSAPAPAQNAHYDDSSFGRQIGESSNDFLDLISSGANDDAIDWSVLGAGFSGQASHNFTPRGASPGTANDLGAGLLAAAAAAAASQPLSDMRHNGTTEADPTAPAEAYATSADEDNGDGLTNSRRNRHHRNSIVESDNAAVSLLQLASANHTPRVSPEPESAPSSSNHDHKPASSSRLHQSYVNPADPDHEIETPETASQGLRSGEETPRLSHLAPHTPSDPWPLAYRPTEPTEDPLPSSARGTGYGSRATSPPPHQTSASPLNQVPHVTESTRYRILFKVRELGDPSLSERYVPRLELLELFVQLYFDKYHSLFPLLHKPTWDPNTAPSFLVLAVASVGARYAHERVVGSSMHAHALLECSRRMMQAMGDLDNTLMRTVAWQQTLLIVLMTGMISGNKRDLERTQTFSSMPTTFARRQGWLKISSSLEGDSAEGGLSIEEKWRTWRDREEIRRLGFGAIMVDCMGTALWNTENAALFADAADTPLPCSEALWNASTALLWQSAYRPATAPPVSPTTSAAIQHVCSPLPSSTSPISIALSKNVFALFTVLASLHALGWTKDHASWTEKSLLNGFDLSNGNDIKVEEEEKEDESKTTLSRGLNYFQENVLLPASMLARLDEPSVTSQNGTMALMLHLAALTHRLPLRTLQPLARVSSPSTHDDLHAWSTRQGGRIARETLYHAGQLFGLSCSPSTSLATGTESPLEPFTLFYSTLAIVAWIKENSTENSTTSDTGDELALDILRDRADPTLSAFFSPSAISSSIIPTLSGLGRLTDRSTSSKVLRLAATRLVGLKCWKVGESLGKTLMEVVAREEAGSSSANGTVKMELTSVLTLDSQ